MIDQNITGIHHISAITADPQKNIDFHAGLLGLRLVKLTVNFDDPSTYHLYFGDDIGNPGTILTYFAWPGVPRGRRGVGQATSLSFSIPEGAEGFWLERFRVNNVLVEQPYQRFEEDVITFYNPDGLKLELVAHEKARERPGWLAGLVPEEYAIRGFHNVTISEDKSGPTVKMLSESLGFQMVSEAGDRTRFVTTKDALASIIDLQTMPGGPGGLVASGNIHHIAWRTPSDTEQEKWRDSLVQDGYHVTEIINRHYFHSIYFREPGGVLFEIATDTPGFTIDEPASRLGSDLKLPPWMESNRQSIIRVLPQLNLKKTGMPI